MKFKLNFLFGDLIYHPGLRPPLLFQEGSLASRFVKAVLVPDRNRDHAELFRTATTDQTGRYIIRGIPQGDYRLFAWETLESFGYFDPELLKQFESQGKAIHISESSTLNQDIHSIRPAL